MNQATKSLLIVVAIIAVLAALFGLNSWRTNRAEGNLKHYDLVDGLLAEPMTSDGEQYLVPPEQLYDSGSDRDADAPIDEPQYVSVSEADEIIADDLPGIDVEVDGEHRFYPYQIMNWHHVVNDEFGGQKLAITYCELCRTPVVYVAELDGRTLTFGTSGLVYNNNYVLYDHETESLWLQSTGQAISGELIGSELTIIPTTTMSWATWKALFPEGEVLSTENGVERDYTRHPFGAYDDSDMIYFPLNFEVTDISAKWLVDGVVDSEGTAIAFSRLVMKGFGAVNEMLGQEPIVALYDYDNEQTRVFSAKVSMIHDLDVELDDEYLTFVYDFEDQTLTDEQTGSTWSQYGVAMRGELKGAELEQIYSQESFWMCWLGSHQNTTISKVSDDGTLEE